MPNRPKIVALDVVETVFALESLGSRMRSADLPEAALKLFFAQMLRGVLAGFAELPPHPDVEPALDRLRAAGVRVIALTNGSAETTRRLFSRARLDSYVERVISIDEVQRWKPNREVYLHAARVAGVAPEQMALVAAHAWDVHGAKNAGLCAAWVKRHDRQFQPAMAAPDVQGETMVDVASALLSMPA